MSLEQLPSKDEPLPLSLIFVSLFGLALAIGWGLMFLLLRERI